MEHTQNLPTGRRKRDNHLLAAEKAAQHFIGIPDGMSWFKAAQIIRNYVEVHLGKTTAYRLMNNYLRMTQAKLRKVADFDPLEHADLFVLFPSNATLCAKYDVSERCVQVNHRRLVEHGLICFNDAPGCQRRPGTGISILPAFAKIRELLQAEFQAEMAVRVQRFLQKEFASCYAKLMCLIDAGVFPDTCARSTLIEAAESARKWSKGKLPSNAELKMADMKQTIEELEAFSLIAYGSDIKDSPPPESGFAHITYKLNGLKKEVSAWREEELSASEIVPETAALVAMPDEPVQLRLPSSDKCVKSVKKLMLLRKLPLVEDDQLNDDQVLGLYGRQAIGEIKLSRPAQAAIAARFGQRALHMVAIQAAHDPKVRHRAAWAAHFASARPENGMIDLQASFFRMVGDYVAAAPA